MKGNPEVIALLNQALKAELTAINQFFLHSRMYEDWGLNKLAEFEYDASIDEMKHADIIIKRILLLGGLPNLQDIGHLQIGEDPVECIKNDLKIEYEALDLYRSAAGQCEQARDYASRDRKSTRLNSSHVAISYAVFCLKKKKKNNREAARRLETRL